jgi:exonuclease VII small subunit
VLLQALTGGRITLEEALKQLSGAVKLNVSADFRIEEIEKTVKSGLKAREGYKFEPTTPYWLGLKKQGSYGCDAKI